MVKYEYVQMHADLTQALRERGFPEDIREELYLL